MPPAALAPGVVIWRCMMLTPAKARLANSAAPLPGDTAHPFRLRAPARRSRTLILGSVAAAALFGALADAAFVMTPTANAAAGMAQGAVAGPVSFADVVERVKGAVVSVKVKIAQVKADDGDLSDGVPGFGQPGPGQENPLEKFFREFGGPQGRGEFDGPRGRGPAPHGGGMSQGSGFFISADGYIVTNNHVVEGASEVTVTTIDGKTLAATVVGADKKTDLALLKVKEAGTFQHVSFSDKAPRVGDWVIAVGNPFGLGGTVTAGIVSARGRDIGAGPYDDFLQIDAPVNRGNSGGPTFNTEGEVVGVNTAIFSPSGGSVGIGFAISADAAKSVVAALKDKGSVARGYNGVQIQPVSDEIADSIGMTGTKGALVADATKNAPAAEAGIKSGDVITAVNGELIDGPKELARKIAGLGPEKKVEITVLRAGASHNFTLTLAALPTEKEARLAKPASEKTSLASLGLELAPASAMPGAGKEGVVVSNVDPDGAAGQRGLRTGDVILEAAGKAVSRPGDILNALADARKDGRKAVLLRVKSGDTTRFVALAPAA